MSSRTDECGRKTGVGTRDKHWRLLRRYLMAGSWLGNALFLAFGVIIGYQLGRFSGARFFSELVLVDRLGNAAALLGAVIGVGCALVCSWSIIVVTSASLTALLYWIRFRCFPDSPQ